VRDARLIDHDDDVDLAVILKATNEAEAAAEWKDLLHKLNVAGILEKTLQDQPAIYKLKPIAEIEFDLFPAWIEEGQVYVYPHTYGALEKDDVLPLQRCAVSGQPIPRNPEKMLEINYGVGWRKPDPIFKFPWNDANARFAAFNKLLNT